MDCFCKFIFSFVENFICKVFNISMTCTKGTKIEITQNVKLQILLML